MCSIEKLLIKGIRSVDPHNETSVEFGTPLSLIVGQNGAGKTTIIECLKQATTGAMPPNSKNGQSFVHDPLIAGETEVKALIKVRLRTARDAAIVVFRSFSLTQNKSKKTFKTLDGSVMVQDDETGEMKVLTNKCAEMDKTVPYVMNVSRSILEHVVFVHQEDSLWPLSESKPLKEKFDAIFAATKYTAGLQKIKEDIKEKNQMIKECKIHLGHLKTHRDTARRLYSTILRGSEQQSALQERQVALAQEMQTLKARANELDEELKQNEQAAAQIERLELRCGMYESEVDKLKQSIGEDYLEGVPSSTELQDMCDKYEAKVARKRGQAVQLTQERKQKASEIDDFRVQAQEASNVAARKEAEIEAHRGQLRQALQLMSALVQQHGMAVAAPAGGGLPPQLQEEVSGELQRLHTASTGALDKLRKENRAAQQAAQQKLSNVQSRIASFQTDVDARSTAQAGIDRKLRHARSRLQALPLPMKLENMQQDLERERAQLAGRNLDADLQQAATDLAAANAAVRTAADTVAALRRERDSLAAATQATTRLRVAQETTAELHSQVQHLQKQHCPALKQALVDLDEPLADIDDAASVPPACLQLLSAAKESNSETQRTADSVRQQLLSKQAELRGLESAVSKADAEGKVASEKVQSTLDGCLATMTTYFAEVPEDLESIQRGFAAGDALQDRYNRAQACLQQMRSEAASRAKLAAAQKQYSETWVKKARDSSMCAVCQRPFDAASECKAFIDRFERNRANASEDAEADEADATELSKQLEAIIGVSGSVQRCTDWQRERPGLQAKLGQLQADCGALEAKAHAAQGEVQLAGNMLSLAQDLQSDLAAPIQQLLQQLHRVDHELQELQTQLQDEDDTSKLPEVEAALSAAESDLQTMTATRDDLVLKRTQLSDDKVKHGSRLLAMEQSFLKLNADMKERGQLEGQVAELEIEQSDVKTQLAALRDGNAPLKHRRAALQAELNSMLTDHEHAEETTRQHVESLWSSLSGWNAMCVEVSRFHTSDAESALEVAQSKVRQVQATMETHVDEVRRLEEAADKATNIAERTEELKRESEEALRYAQAVEELQQVQVELDARRAASKGGGWAAIRAQRDKANSQIHQLDLQASSMAGELNGLASRMKESETELAQPQYNDIGGEYRRKEVELRTLEMGNKDFQQYCKGLEKALLSYHSKKMESINQVLKELWQKTYRGQDIEYIEIRADTADSGKSAYNYRVIMHAAGAELDMRGRCSAGQKVLACILIRMALAESFCANCGVIALDEPTTNLDMANSAALAQALRSILDTRSTLTHETDRVFQLIVITHDENFATQLGAHDYCEFMTRVTKDENHHTKLTEEPID